MDIIIDSSALMPILINEPEKNFIVNATENCNLFAPSMLPYEIGNALTRLKKRKILNDQEIVAAYRDFKKIPLRLIEVDIENALLLACKYTIYAYDAYYLETACRLNMPLLTLDGLMRKIALGLKLEILEG